jgi:hypothetical protein
VMLALCNPSIALKLSLSISCSFWRKPLNTFLHYRTSYFVPIRVIVNHFKIGIRIINKIRPSPPIPKRLSHKWAINSIFSLEKYLCDCRSLQNHSPFLGIYKILFPLSF